MFTPQRSAWSLKSKVSSETPRSKDKGITGNLESAAASPPRFGSLNGGELGRGGEDTDAWKRFRDEGLLDESIFHKKDREALDSRIIELEKDLHEYQYNMGLLLIEKKERCSNFEEMKARLAEAEEILRLEQAAHIIELTESKKREENLRKALGVEKQCVSDLEKASREMRYEIAEVKYTSEKKMTEALAMEASIEEKSLEIKRNLHSADAKLAEASRKSSEINRKLEDVEDRERKVQRELNSINSERKALKKDISEQKEHLREWEKKLQDEQNSDPHPSKDPTLIQDFQSPSWLLFELEHSIKTLESMKLSTIITFINSINQKIDYTISLLQSNLLTIYLSDFEKKKIIDLSFRIWNICIELTKEYPIGHDLEINDFGFFAVDLDELVKNSMKTKKVRDLRPHVLLKCDAKESLC